MLSQIPMVLEIIELRDLPGLPGVDRSDIIEDAEVVIDFSLVDLRSASARAEAREREIAAQRHAHPRITTLDDGLEPQAEQMPAGRHDLARVGDAAVALVGYRLAAALSTIWAAAALDPRMTELHLKLLGLLAHTTNGKSGISWLTNSQAAGALGVALKTVYNRSSELAAWGYTSKTDARRTNAKGLSATLDTAIRPAGYPSWEALRQAVDDSIRTLRRDPANFTRPLPYISPIQGTPACNSPHPGSADFPHPGKSTQADFSQSGKPRQIDFPSREEQARHSLYKNTTDTRLITDTSATTVTSGAPDGAVSPELPLTNGVVIEMVAGEIEPPAKFGQGKRSASRREQLDPDRHTSPEWRDEARRIGLSDEQIASAFEQFRDHHHSKGSMMIDWLAAWRTWCRNELKFAANRAPKAAPGRMSRPSWRDA